MKRLEGCTSVCSGCTEYGVITDTCRWVYCDSPTVPTPAMRNFESGATRNVDEGRVDYEGFLCPMVLERYAEYMNKNRVQADGAIRASDNWQKGIPISAYMKSKFRHFMATWKGYRKDNIQEDDLCAELFNTMGMLHELLKQRSTP